MNRMLPRVSRSLSFLLLVLPAAAAVAQDGPGANVDREKMWPAPTEEDWKKPCLITWQRTWEDAVAVSRRTRKPILVCVNMDGEIASEHYAGIRYRQPEIAELYEPYVCVIASVYRHTPRDHDEEGRRIPCPRFGTVTCGEHIAIEPLLHEKFMDGRRIAPRHIMVELDGEETYDVYYAWDTDSVFEAIRDGIAGRDVETRPLARGDRSIVERVDSRDVRDRMAVEEAYRQGDRELRQRLLEAARQHTDKAPVDLLRLAVFGFDRELGREARDALTAMESPRAVGLISDALRVPMAAEERDALIGALERIGESSPRARKLAVVHQGLSRRSERVDAQRWSEALAGGEYPAPPSEAEVVDGVDRSAGEAAARPGDAGARLELAEASLELAVERRTTVQRPGERYPTLSRFSTIMFQDAYRTALEAEEMGASGWRLDAVVALSAFYLEKTGEAHRRAERAVEALPAGVTDWNAMAVLGLFAEARMQQIHDAVTRKEDWPAEWLTDVHAAYSVLLEHPRATASHVVAYYDFLRGLEGTHGAGKVLDRGLRRFPGDGPLHRRLRRHVLRTKGVAGLETVYDAMLAEEDAAPELPWFAGYAANVAAEFHRRRGNRDRALEAYDRAIARFEQAIEAAPESRDSAGHHIALALAGKARIAFERGEDEAATGALLAALERRPESAAVRDGLNISPVDTAKMLRARLAEREEEELLARLQAALDRLEPEQLALPDYERDGNRPRRRGRRRDG